MNRPLPLRTFAPLPADFSRGGMASPWRGKAIGKGARIGGRAVILK